MSRLKPTILIALDRHAAAFCERVQLNLERDLGYRGSLVKSYSVALDDKTGPAIDANLSAIADFSFTLSTTKEPNTRTAAEVQAVFEARSFELEPQLSEIFEAGRRYDEIQKAREAGIEIARNRTVYLALSSADSAASGMVIEVARLIRWLFATRFPQELYELHAVVLLPNLFEQATQTHFAAAYALLKKLDHNLLSGLTITPLRKMPPFDGCWLIDGINARGEKVGTLAEQLDSYTDAFTGFLTAEPEMSGALVGTRTSRGKVPAYSTFGHGEIYFPMDVAVKRLSSALSRDIIHHAFLNDDAEQADVQRKMLLVTKQFVLSEQYRSTLNALETEKGAPIWQDLPRINELPAGSDIHQYLAEQQRHHTKFERESLPKFKQALMARSEASLPGLVRLLDEEIDRRIDQKPEGFSEALALLEWFVDYGIALNANTLAERPQNFFTDLLAAEAMLDMKLGLEVDHSKTELLLKEVNDLNNRRADLENTLLITKSRAADAAPAEEATGGDAENSAADSLRSEHRNLLSEREQTRSQIASASATYVRELITEERAANELRYEGKEKARADGTQAVADAEQEIIRAAELLNRSRMDLEDKQQQRHQFLVRHFIVYPALAALLLIVPGLASLFGVTFAAAFMGLFWAPSFGFLLVIITTLAVYTAVVLYSFVTGINRTVNSARDEVHSLELRLKAAHVRLLDARNKQLRLEYDIYAQSMRVETVNKLIEMTRQRITEIENTQNALHEWRAKFAAEHKSTLPASSYMRRPVLTAEQIDNFYRSVTNVETESQTFILEHVPRSHVRRLAIEDFAQSLLRFASSRFTSLSNLTIEDVLLRSPDLMSKDQASLRLDELDRAATPLVLLSEMDLNDDTFAQKDVTIWAGASDTTELLQRYSTVNSPTTVRPSNNEYSLRALTRCLNFPAFYLSQIEFYRSCYDRLHENETVTLPDIIPDELTVSGDFRRAYEYVVIAIAIGLISNNGDGAYQVVNGTGSIIGSSRRQVAEKFVVDYSSQKLYAEIGKRVVACDSQTIYDALITFIETTSDLAAFEQEILVTLSQRYHPLR
jgi:Tubulin like